jgi:pimeloyl-ACP methyl ester carboxylesterase
MKKIIIRLIGLYLNTLAIVAPRKAGRLGFELFLYPYRIPISQKQRSFLDAAALTRIDFRGVKLQAYRWGSGPKNILLLHGWQSHSYRWKAYVEAINKEEYSIYAFDAPGHGLSTGKFLSVPLYSDAIETLINQLGTIDCVISHSFGGFSILHALYTKPTLNVKRIVAMASPVGAQEFFDFYKKTLGLSETCVAVTIKHFTQVFQQPPGYFSAPFFASAMDVPGLIIHDEDDRETPVLNSKHIHQSWKNSRLFLTKGLGHNLKSHEVVREAIQFFNQPVDQPGSDVPLVPFNTTDITI